MSADGPLLDVRDLSVAFGQGAQYGLAQCLHGLLIVHFRDLVIRRVVSALEKEVAQLLDQILQIHLVGEVAGKF